jgi:hypothetical protein
MNARSNEDLAKQLGTQFSRFAAAPPDPAPAPPPAPARTEEAPLPPPPVGESEAGETLLSDVERTALFQALARGTEKHLGRAPTVRELSRLFDDVAKARHLDSFARAALSANVEVYWNGDDWTFEGEPSQPPTSPLGSMPLPG